MVAVRGPKIRLRPRSWVVVVVSDSSVRRVKVSTAALRVACSSEGSAALRVRATMASSCTMGTATRYPPAAPDQRVHGRCHGVSRAAARQSPPASTCPAEPLEGTAHGLVSQRRTRRARPSRAWRDPPGPSRPRPAVAGSGRSRRRSHRRRDIARPRWPPPESTQCVANGVGQGQHSARH